MTGGDEEKEEPKPKLPRTRSKFRDQAESPALARKVERGPELKSPYWLEGEASRSRVMGVRRPAGTDELRRVGPAEGLILK